LKRRDGTGIRREKGMKNCKPGILFQEGCVLQRGKPIRIWGDGQEGKRVSAELNGKKAYALVENGRWECELPAMEAMRDLTLRIACEGEEELIENVSVGEVWIAGGQSNMAYEIRFDASFEEMKALPMDSDIHMFNVPRLAYPGQVKDTPDSGFWFQEGDAAWEFFSAPAYAFARSLSPKLGVPIGIIGCNWGGASASVWVKEEYMAEEPLRVYLREYEEKSAGRDPEELKRQAEAFYRAEESPEHKKAMDDLLYGLSLAEQEEWKKRPGAALPENAMGPYNVGRPGSLYHTMLTRIAPYSARGVIWYHGESDAHHAEIYDRLLGAVTRCFRDSFRQELPFLLVQLAPFGRWLWCRGEKFPELRYRQELASRKLPGVYLTSIMDLGMYEDLHPKRKKEVGERLALLALGKIYGRDILCECPELREAGRKGEELVLSFEHAGAGLWIKEEEPEAEAEAAMPSALTGPEEMKLGFLVSCQGKRFEISRVEPLNDRVLLEVPGLPDLPCQVSFGELPYLRARIFNSAGLPLKPFHVEL